MKILKKDAWIPKLSIAIALITFLMQSLIFISMKSSTYGFIKALENFFDTDFIVIISILILVNIISYLIMSFIALHTYNQKKLMSYTSLIFLNIPITVIYLYIIIITSN